LLAGRGVDHITLQRYLVWRRSVFLFVIVITLTSAVMNTVNDVLFPGDPVRGIVIRLDADDQVAIPTAADHTRFNDLADNVMGVLLYALPLSAFGAAFTWRRWRLSRRWLLAGWLAGFLVPMLLAICPLSWWQPEPGNAAVDLVYGVAYGLQWFILLLPAVLSLLPGMVRACLRIKSLLPESIIAGWILVAAAPFYSLLLLVVWVAICHVVTNVFLLLGMVLWIATPLVYVLHRGVLTKPVVAIADVQRIRRAQFHAKTMSCASMLLLLTFVFTAQLLGMYLVGFDVRTSLVRPWVVLQYVLEYWGRSLFTTVLAADFFMRVNRSIWQAEREFAARPEASEYDGLMSQLGQE